jgi:hypothetical protein
VNELQPVFSVTVSDTSVYCCFTSILIHEHTTEGITVNQDYLKNTKLTWTFILKLCAAHMGTLYL